MYSVHAHKMVYSFIIGRLDIRPKEFNYYFIDITSCAGNWTVQYNNLYEKQQSGNTDFILFMKFPVRFVAYSLFLL